MDFPWTHGFLMDETWISHMGNMNNFGNEAPIGTTYNHYNYTRFIGSLNVFYIDRKSTQVVCFFSIERPYLMFRYLTYIYIIGV